jgi:uncharacterized protein (TIGR03437 family)
LVAAWLLAPAAWSQGLTITSPGNFAPILPGQSISFTVTMNPTSDFGFLLLYGTSPLGLLGGHTAAASVTIKATLPADLKPSTYTITAVGYTNTGSAVISKPVTLAVEPSPSALTVTPGQMFFKSIGAQLPAFAGGTLPDGTFEDFTNDPLLTWTSSNTKVATVSSEGVVTAVGNGTAVVRPTTSGGPGIRVTVSAPASPCTYALNTVTANAGSGGGPLSVNVTASNAACEWSAVSWAPWIAVTSGKLGRGSGTVALAVAGNTGAARTATVAIAGSNVTISQAPSNGPAAVPAIAANGVVNGASFVSGGIVPGEIATIFGTNLTTATGINLASTLPLPAQFMTVQVLVNGNAAPIFAVDNVNGQQQINFQVPFEAGAITTATVQVVSNGLAGNTITVPVIAQPGIFGYTSGSTVYGAILHADYSLADTGNPAVAGETVLIYCTGLGFVSPAQTDGTPAPGAASTTLTPTVSIGGAAAAISYSGLAPSYVGLYQINAVVPSGLPSGNQPVMIKIGGVQSSAAMLPVM